MDRRQPSNDLWILWLYLQYFISNLYIGDIFCCCWWGGYLRNHAEIMVCIGAGWEYVISPWTVLTYIWWDCGLSCWSIRYDFFLSWITVIILLNKVQNYQLLACYVSHSLPKPSTRDWRRFIIFWRLLTEGLASDSSKWDGDLADLYTKAVGSKLNALEISAMSTVSWWQIT